MVKINQIAWTIILMIFFVSAAVNAQEIAATDSFNYYYVQKNYSKALEFWTPVGVGCKDFEMIKNAGNCYYYLCNYEEALKYYFIANAQLTNKDTVNQISILINIGNSYENQGSFQKAREYLFKARAFNVKHPCEHESRLDLSLGQAYCNANMLDSAEVFMLLALDSYKRQYGEGSERMLYIYENLIKFYNKTASSNKAIYYGKLGLKLCTQLFNQNPWWLFTFNYNLGIVYYGDKNWDKSIPYFNAALSNINDNNKAFKPYIETALAYCYTKSGIIFSDLYFISDCNETGKLDTTAYAYYLNYYGKFMANQKKDTAASNKYYRKALFLLQHKYGRYHDGIKDMYIILGFGNSLRHRSDSSLYYYQRALYCQFPEVDTNDYASNPTDLRLANTWLLDLTGRKLKALNSLRQQHNLPDSTFAINSLIITNSDYYRRCLEMLLRDKTFLADQLNILREDIRRYMLMGMEACYSMYTATNNRYYFEKGLEFSESGKYLLVKSMMDSKANKQQLPEKIVQADAELFSRINSLQMLIVRQQEQSGNADTEESEMLNSRLFKLILRKDSLRNVILSQFPGYHRQLAPQLSMDEIQSQLDRHEVLIEYFYQDSVLHTLCLTSAGIAWKRINGGSTLKTAIRRVSGFCNPTEENNISKTEYIHNATFLTPVLLGIADSLNPTASHYLLVPDGELTFLPFETLLTGPADEFTPYSSMPYVLFGHTVGYYYSIRFLDDPGINNPNRARGFLAIAPGFGNSSSMASRDGVIPIGEASEEAEQLQEMLRGELLRGKNATLENLLRHIPGKDILHFATHAEFDAAHPFASRLMLFTDSATNEPQPLYASEICSMELDARLAVLSSCNTGNGQVLNGEGVISLAWAFSYAGCQSVAMSLFPLDDGSARRIMTSFYHHLREGRPKDESLRMAKMEFILGMVPAMTHPRYWAGILVSGDQQAIFDNHRQRNGILLASIFLAGLVLMGNLVRKRLKRKF